MSQKGHDKIKGRVCDVIENVPPFFFFWNNLLSGLRGSTGSPSCHVKYSTGLRLEYNCATVSIIPFQILHFFEVFSLSSRVHKPDRDRPHSDSKIQQSDSPDHVIRLFQERENEFKDCRDRNWKLINVLKPARTPDYRWRGQMTVRTDFVKNLGLCLM